MRGRSAERAEQSKRGEIASRSLPRQVLPEAMIIRRHHTRLCEPGSLRREPGCCIKDALTAGEIAIVQTKLRIEFRELLKDNYRDFIKKDVIGQIGNTMRDGYFVDCRCDEICVVIYAVSPLDHSYSASFDCNCRRKRKPLEKLPLRG